MFNTRPPFRCINFWLAILSFQNILKYIKDNMICSVADAVYVLSLKLLGRDRKIACDIQLASHPGGIDGQVLINARTTLA